VEKFYLTTPIYYVNAKPHLGTTYTTVIADIIARFMRMNGKDTLMVTGSDEHSQGIADLSEKEGVPPREFCDRIIPTFHEAWKLVDIEDYHFERTSDEKHRNVVRKFFKRIWDKGDIYKGEYSGWYHTTDNRFLIDDEVTENPEKNPRLKYLTEEAYFFKLSAYEDVLLAFHEANPVFVIPEFRRTEMLNRINEGLKDLCISRTSTAWGVPLPWDAEHVFYVWVDALLTYLTGSGFDIDGYLDAGGLDLPSERLWALGKDDIPGQGNFSGNYWPCDLNIMAKDIPWFHAVIFPALLLSFGLPPVKQMIVHGYWNFGGDKMSKSLGNVVSPQEACDIVGADGLRYFFAREVPLGLDGNFTLDLLIDRYNYDLGNDLGNLVHRTISLSHQLFEGVVPASVERDECDEQLLSVRERVIADAKTAYEEYRLNDALKLIWELVRAANKYFDEKQPWTLKRKPERRDEVATVFACLYEVLKSILFLISPVTPGAAQKMWNAIGLKGELAALGWGELAKPYPANTRVEMGKPVFPRVEKKKAVEAEAQLKESTKAAGAEIFAPDVSKKIEMPEGVVDMIEFDDFQKVELTTALVKSAERVAGTDRLIHVKLDDGTDEGREIVAGIAEWYKPEELIGKTLIVVANLKPRKMRGVESKGMLLAAQDGEGGFSILTVERPVKPGAEIK